MYIEKVINESTGKPLNNCLIVWVDGVAHFFSYETKMFEYELGCDLTPRSGYRSHTTSKQLNAVFKQLGLNVNANRFYNLATGVPVDVNRIGFLK